MAEAYPEPVEIKPRPSLYQNPLSNPSNSVKAIGPVPVLSTEAFLLGLEDDDERNQTGNPYLYMPKQPEGWDELVDHSNFIENMFASVQEEANGQVLQNPPSTSKQVKKGTSNSAISQKPANPGGKLLKTRKLEAPWRNNSPFVSPSELQKKAFQSFAKMSPEPPKATLHPVTTLSPSAESKNKNPPKREKSEQYNVVSMFKMDLVPASKYRVTTPTTRAFPKSKSLPLPANASRVMEPIPSPFSSGKIHLERNPPVRTQPISTPKPAYNYQAPISKPSPILEMPKVSHPMPFSKRRELFPQNQPPLYHSVYYGSGKRLNAPMPPQMKVKQILGNWKQVKSGVEAEMNKIPGLQSGSGVDSRGARPIRKVRPAMLFPYHVPGPKHDNIYIGAYHGSDTESDNENETK